ncbi:MAG TPA: ferritin-like domain-containing protein [Nannocystaceae bacterium]|nr:ferritin-like domain-containing protein [Nannocystaceae bacterium]
MTPTSHAGLLWACRANAELDAAARFQRLATILRDTGARALVVDMARAAVDDEHRHHVRCAALARRFGATPAPACGHAPALAAGLRTPVEQALYETVAMSCVTETLSTALLMEIRAAAIDDEVAATADEILRDEVDHARLGWAHLAAEAPRRDLAFLGPRLPAVLAHTVHEEIFGEHDDGPLAHAVAGLGGLPRARRYGVLVQTMRDVVFPGLRSHGVDTSSGERWLAHRE